MPIAAGRPIVNVRFHSGGASAGLIIGAALIALLGSILVALAAYFAARLAARTATERQEQQLEADFVRFEARLDHERMLHRRDHMRDAVDNAIEGVDKIVNALASMASTVSTQEQRRRDARAVLADDTANDEEKGAAQEYLREAATELHEKSVPIFDLLTAAISQGLRLRIRFHEHPVPATHRKARRAFDARHRLLQPSISRSLTDDELAILKDDEENPIGDALTAFFDACEAWLAEEEELHPAD